jgi:hypothetical protein
MLHPVESMWMYFGPNTQTSAMRDHLDGAFKTATEALLFGQLDFDYIGESVLAEIGSCRDGRLEVGQMAYDAVVVPNCLTLRESTYKLLKQFRENGGTLVFAGDLPEYIDAKPSRKGKELAADSLCVPMEAYALQKALEPFSEVEILSGNGSRHTKMLYQLRQDGKDRWLFTAYGRKKERYDTEGVSKLTIKMPGQWIPILYDTMTGNICRIAYTFQDGYTYVNRTAAIHDSILLRFTGDSALAEKFPMEEEPFKKERQSQPCAAEAGKVPVTLEEPNVCLLDIFEYKIDEGAYQPLEEILRIEDKAREICGLSPKGGAAYSGAQPWTFQEETAKHRLSLRIRVESEIALDSVLLALEHPEDTRLFWNGEAAEGKELGCYVDDKIRKITLGPLKKGTNVLELSYPLGETTAVEACYLLGDFGVRLEGAFPVLTPGITQLAFGDITAQGLPFYGGNLVYHIEKEISGSGLVIHAPYYRGSLIGVAVDGQRQGILAFAPYTLQLPLIEEGKHTIDLTLFGTRVNTFGALHNCNENTTWFGPPAWRSSGDSFSYEYQPKRQGILKAPEIY